MIQRIQTLFLLGVVACMVAVFFLPLWEKTKGTGETQIALDVYYLTTYDMEPDGTKEVLSKKNVIYIAAIFAAAGLVALISIFQYKNRLRQIKLGALTALLLMGGIVAEVMILYRAEQLFDTGMKGDFEIGFFVPLLALIFNSLANRFIRRDEKLVRSVDRIR
ncbi:MAG TPA: DUF4293 domain-containing protein [Cytophagales bacterium]|jgi:glucan phosphoethanolaminetransferase (alkaline phosphatase superfamily)|nr:DUF4293 domain-containing protein [Cytophagales bacterium]